MINISQKVEKFADYFSNIVMKLKSAAIPMMNFIWCYNLYNRTVQPLIFLLLLLVLFIQSCEI